MSLLFTPLPTETVRPLQQGGKDANGQQPERNISDGSGLPCRHCLQDIDAGERYLILSYKPFETTQPYAEQGPIFLHEKECVAYSDPKKLPPRYDNTPEILLRGYNQQDRIVYGTGQIVATPDIYRKATEIFDAEEVAYVHARSASNNCFQFRIDLSD